MAKKLSKKNRVYHASELMEILGGRTSIGLAVEDGLIYPLGAGHYASMGLDPFVASVIAVSKHYKNAVISNLTALVIHTLSDEYINAIDVDIKRQQSIRNKLIQTHRVYESHIIGVQKLKYFNHIIRVYNIERCLCEAYKIDGAGPLFFKALKRYVKQGNVKANRIKRYDDILKTQVLDHLRQEIADE